MARHLSLDYASPSFLFAVEDFDRRERGKEASGLVAVSALKEDLSAAEGLLDDAAAKLQKAKDDLRAAEDAASMAEEAAREADQRRQQAELEASTEKMLREALQRQLAERPGASLNEQMKAGLRAVVCHQARGQVDQVPTPRQALETLQALFPDRLAVLPEALDSADREGEKFRKPLEVLDLLIRLATTYYERLQRGGDAQAKEVFSKKEYAAKGSSTEMTSPACARDRTRTYKGNAIVMWSHLRAGGNGGPDACLRIHFDWVADEKRIVIGHCGAHLSEA